MLAKKLEERKIASEAKRDDRVNGIMYDSTQSLKNLKLAENAANIGDKLPDANLINHLGDTVKLYDYLKGRPTIISFYRGTWCPYCNMEIAEYNELLQGEDVNMLAISPEKPDAVNVQMDMAALPFTVLSDVDNGLANELKLVFTLSDDLLGVYQTFNIDLEKSQGNSKNSLPIPATYIVDANGVIVKAWIDADYTVRAEPSEVISAYKAL